MMLIAAWEALGKSMLHVSSFECTFGVKPCAAGMVSVKVVSHALAEAAVCGSA
jgi:hypothetical protein